MKPCDELEIAGLDATYRKYYLKGYEDAEKEHNYHLKKIRAEIDSHCSENRDRNDGLYIAMKIIDKYKAESKG